jgi:response regulator RpfG family c-di-GMP phosphodiesterase
MRLFDLRKNKGTLINNNNISKRMYKALFISMSDEFSQKVTKYISNINKDITIFSASNENEVRDVLEVNKNIDVIVCDHEPPKLDAIKIFNQRTRVGDLRPFIIVSPTIDADLAIKAFELRVDYYICKSSSAMNFYMNLASKIVICAERKHANTMQTINVKRLKALVQISRMNDRPFKEVIEYVLRTTIELTNSRFGYIALYDSNKRSLRLIAYSQGLDEYHQTVTNIDRTYPLDEVGLWGVPILKKQNVRINDFNKDDIYNSKQWPSDINLPIEGLDITRTVMIPIIHNGVVLATAGVAN